VKALEDTRAEQEHVSNKIEQLSGLVIQISSRDGVEPIPSTDSRHTEKMKIENNRLRKLTDRLKRENVELNNKVKSLYTRGVEGARAEKLQNAMQEKDRLLEECYNEKKKLQDQLDKERRDKYEIIQKYETEKKELIDTLALERIQREKDRAELELLRAESRKKKWW